MDREMKAYYREAYKQRVAARYTEEYLTESLLWQVLRPLEYQNAMACTLRRQPDRFEQLMRLPVPLRLVEAVDGEYSVRV